MSAAADRRRRRRGREGVIEEGHDASEVLHGRPQPAHRRQGAVAERRVVGYRRVVLDPVRAGPVVVPRTQPRRALQAERLQQQLADEILQALAGVPLDHTPDDGEAQVGVLERRCGRYRESRTGGEDRVQLGRGHVEMAVRPRVVSGQPRLHGEQMAQRDRRPVAGGPDRQVRDRLVEGEHAIVTEA